MKIENTGPLRPHSLQRNRGTNSTKSGEFSQHISAPTTASAAEVNTPAPPETLWFLQEISDEETKKRKAYQRGKTILETLEELRIDIISGLLPPNRLIDLNKLLSKQKEQVTDAKLLEIITEIELRAHVELAKLGVTQSD